MADQDREESPCECPSPCSLHYADASWIPQRAPTMQEFYGFPVEEDDEAYPMLASYYLLGGEDV